MRSLASLLVLAVVLLAPTATLAAPTGAIRTGGPSAPDDAKVAIVAGPRSLAGSVFRVYRGKKLVLRGHLRRGPHGSAPWPAAFRANVSRLHGPARYTVRAAGRRSRPWLVSRRGSTGLIPLILRFFETNRDGEEPALLHGPSHLHDATVRGGRYAGRHFDLTGGWMDAGDMLHFTQTTAYATMVLEAAARLDPGQATPLREEAGVGVRWLLKAHPAPGLFIAQVGDNRDHQRYFTNPDRDDASRQPGIGRRLAFHWGAGAGGDLGGKVAAALAMAASDGTEPDSALLIERAREWFKAGRAAHRATPPLPHAGDFYVVSNWRDSMAAGAAALYRATGEPSYLKAARHYLAGSSPGETMSYGNVAPLAAADLCGRLGAPGLGPRGTRRQGCRFLRRNARGTILYARRNAFGVAAPPTWGTTSSNGASGAIAAISGLRAGPATGAGARDYLLGRNPWGASFVAGFGPKSPRQISSWAAVFGAGRPRGAVVGGPAPRKIVRSQGFSPKGPLRRFNGASVYEDNRRDYVTSEPALDYAANSILLLAAVRPHEPPAP
jgi:endoglucanase